MMSTLPAHLWICSVTVILLISGVACGQDTGARLTLLDVLDADDDGELSAREITRSAPLIRRLDLNKDGRLTGDELNASDEDDRSDSDAGSDARGRPGRDSNSSGNTASRGRGSRGDSSGASKSNIDAAINRAAMFFQQKKYNEAGKQIERAQELIEQLIDEDEIDTLDELTASLKRFDRAHKLLTAQGVDLPEALDLSDFGVGAAQPPRRAASARARAADTAGSADKASSTGTVSFTRQIAPILVKNCGGCHVKDNKGELSFASYSALMTGSAGGEVVKAGNADSSFLVDMVESGDMPPEGDPLSDDQLKLIRTWIDEGAVFDGDDEEAKLSSK